MEKRDNTDHTGYRTVVEGGTGEIEEKKSRFICDIQPVRTEEEAESFLAETRKKHRDARHHCFACVIGKRQELVRCSDDGEPSGTAGRPMLEVLTGEKLCFTAAVVTRYFGGTLLGTGGLVRAYTQAVQTSLMNCRAVWMTPGVRLQIQTDYSDVGKIIYMLEKRGIRPEKSEYGETVKIWIILSESSLEEIRKELMDLTDGKIVVQILERGDFQLD
jgi:uncharacterized YigZ family protein